MPLRIRANPAIKSQIPADAPTPSAASPHVCPVQVAAQAPAAAHNLRPVPALAAVAAAVAAAATKGRTLAADAPTPSARLPRVYPVRVVAEAPAAVGNLRPVLALVLVPTQSQTLAVAPTPSARLPHAYRGLKRMKATKGPRAAVQRPENRRLLLPVQRRGLHMVIACNPLAARRPRQANLRRHRQRDLPQPERKAAASSRV